MLERQQPPPGGSKVIFSLFEDGKVEIFLGRLMPVVVSPIVGSVFRIPAEKLPGNKVYGQGECIQGKHPLLSVPGMNAMIVLTRGKQF